MKKIFYSAVMALVSILALNACSTEGDGSKIMSENVYSEQNTMTEGDTEQSLQVPSEEKDSEEIPSKEDEQTSSVEQETLEATENNYSISVYTEAPNQNSSISIQYPVFTGDGKEALNNLVYNKVCEFAEIDTSLFSNEAGLIIDYQSVVTLLNRRVVSIIFWGLRTIEGAAYGTDNLISLNIDLQTLEEITFEDLYTVDDNFEKIFFEKAYFPTEPITSYDESGFTEMLMLQSPEYQAISPFSIAGNVSCFLKPEGIVLSMPAVHATGSDHFEAQLNYDDIDKFYKPELKYWD